MKSLSLKVMTLLMAALVLSDSGCSNENEMSSPEGTVKGFLKTLKHGNHKRWNRSRYLHPVARTYVMVELMSVIHLDRARAMAMRKDIDVSNVKTTLVSKKESRVMLDDKKWHRVKNENATVEVSYKLNGENFQQTVKLVLMDNKWYIISWR